VSTRTLVNSRTTRITAAGAGAALCLGITVPASAHTGSTTTHRDPAQQTSYPKPTLAQVQQWIDTFIGYRLQVLDRLGTKAAADPHLTADQKAQVASRIAAAKADLTALKAAVDSATSIDQVHDLVAAAIAKLPHPPWPAFAAKHTRHHHHLRRHHAASATDTSTRTRAVRTVVVNDPGRATAHTKQPCDHGSGMAFDGRNGWDGRHRAARDASWDQGRDAGHHRGRHHHSWHHDGHRG
jgi:hypothetical protein